MTVIPFCGQTYQDKTLYANAQRAINLYPMRTTIPQYSSQKLPYPSAPEKLVMYPTPGYKFAQACASFASSQQTPIRGLYVINSTLYIVCGNVLLSFTPQGTNTDLTVGTFATLGTLNTSTGIVSIQCNTVQLAISDGSFGYTYNLATRAFATISGGSFPASGGVTNFAFYDDYIVGAVNGSRQVIQSNILDATTFGAQAFDTVASFVDNAVCVFSDGLILYVMGPRLTEVQVDVGSIPYAFQKQAGVLIQAGCAAPFSVTKVGNTIIWLAQDFAGKAFVATLQGYGAKPISTPPINEAIERYSKISDAFGYTYREGDNQFYVLTFPTANATWVYDVKMDMWHERSINGGADLPTAYVNWQGNHVVGDKFGNLLLLSQNYSSYYDGSTGKDFPLTRVRTCQHLNAEGKSMFINELWIDMQVGSGFYTDPNLATQPTATAPLATLEVSKDYGNKWIVVGTRSLGVQGKYPTRVLWRNLGRFRQNATFRLTVTDPVATFITGAKATIKTGVK